MTSVKAGASPAWPAVSTNARGWQRPSAARWIFVVSPPRERPIAWSCRLRLPGPLLRALAACWWARTIVEFTETAQLRSSPVSAWTISAVNTRSQVPSMAHIRSWS